MHISGERLRWMREKEKEKERKSEREGERQRHGKHIPLLESALQKR